MAKSSGPMGPTDARSSAVAAGGSNPVPHFDSILRAAPAYDVADDGEDAEDLQTTEDTDEYACNAPSADEIPTVADAIRPHLVHHSSLHAYLDANQMLENMIITTQAKVHEDGGKLSVKRAELRRAQEQLNILQVRKGKSAMLWMPKKKHAHRSRLAEVTGELRQAQSVYEELERDLSEDKRHLAALHNELTEFKRVEARLDALYNHVFSGLTPNHPDEDELEQKYHILVQTARRLQVSVDQEKRARLRLDKSFALCEQLLKELLKGLQIGIDIGVANNVKHKHQLFVGTSAFASARQSRGILLRAKTLCGDLHTHYISARAAQRRINKMPKLEVLELSKMPDMHHNKNKVDEFGLHRSLESSYAQGKAARSHIETERQKSKKRQRLLREEIEVLNQQAKSAWLDLRAVRRDIVDVVTGSTDHDTLESAFDGMNATTQATTPRAPLDEPQPRAERNTPAPSAIVVNSSASNSPSSALRQRTLNLSPPRSADATPQRQSMSSSLPPPYRREFASQSSLGLAFPPLTTTDSGTLADFAARSDWDAREQHRLLTLPNAFRRVIDRESTLRSRDIITRIAVNVGGYMDDADRDAVGHLDTPAEEDIPGFHLMFT